MIVTDGGVFKISQVVSPAAPNARKVSSENGLHDTSNKITGNYELSLQRRKKQAQIALMDAVTILGTEDPGLLSFEMILAGIGKVRN